MSEPLTPEERSVILANTAPGSNMDRLLADLERTERERDEALVALAALRNGRPSCHGCERSADCPGFEECAPLLIRERDEARAEIARLRSEAMHQENEADYDAYELTCSHAREGIANEKLRQIVEELNVMALKLAAVERERDEARNYASEIAQGVSHYPHGEGEPCVRCERDEVRAERDRDLADMRIFQQRYMEADHARRDAEKELSALRRCDGAEAPAPCHNDTLPGDPGPPCNCAGCRDVNVIWRDLKNTESERDELRARLAKVVEAGWRLATWWTRAEYGLNPLQPTFATLLLEFSEIAGECPEDISKRPPFAIARIIDE